MRAEKARRRLVDFAKLAWPVVNPGRPLVWGWYLDVICEHLEAVTLGQIVKLLIIQPPNTLKSTVVSVLWPAWEWARDPSVRWLFAANELGLATRDAGFSRELITSAWFRERWGQGWRMRPDSDEKTWYSTTKGGHRISLSTNARVTGKKGDRLVVDDPHDARKVQSELDRAAVKDWFGSAFLSRRADERTTPVVVAGQRVAEDDLISELKKQGDWVVLRLTEEFNPAERCRTFLWSDPRTEPGEWLRPERFAEAERDKRIREATFAVYACQHNDDPKHIGGKYFDRRKANVIPVAPAGTVAVRYWDTAATKGVASANTAGVLVGRTPAGRFVILDCTADNCTPAERKAIQKQVCAADVRRPGVHLLSTWIEQPGGFGTESVQSDIRDLAGYYVQANKVGSSSGSKEERWKPLSAQWEVGNVDVVAADWTEAFLAEMDAAPGGTRLDRADAAAGGFNKLTEGGDGAEPQTGDAADTVTGSLPDHTWR